MKTEIYTPDFYILDGEVYPYCGVIRILYPELSIGSGKIEVFFNTNQSVEVEAVYTSVDQNGQKILNLFSCLDDYYRFLDILS